MRAFAFLAVLAAALCAGISGFSADATTVGKESDPSAALNGDPHLVGWWKFDEVSGTNAIESSPQPHPGALRGGFTFDSGSVPGRVGKALKFPGGDSFVQIPGHKGVCGTQARTIAAWIKTTSPDGELVAWGSDDFGKMWVLGFIRARIGVTPKGGYYYMKAPVNDDAWHHVAVVVEAASPPNLHDNVRLYKDGELAEVDDIGLLDLWPIDTGNSGDVRIGHHFKGLLDEVRIYDRALTEDEVKVLYKGAQKES